MKKINIFCFGFGRVAKSFINKVNLESHNIILHTTSRSETAEKNFKGIKYQNYQFKDEKYDEKLIPKLIDADHICISIPPNEGEDLVIKKFSRFIDISKVKWITYLSATSVYGDHKGEWVNENSETKPVSPNGVARLKTENSWLALKKDKNFPVQIFRLSGIRCGRPDNGCIRASPRECAGSVLTTSVRIPASLKRTAQLAAVVVLPTPPLPP